MKYNCELIRDLLPLYQDGICSQSSKAAVEEHLSECEGCSSYLESLRSGEELEQVMSAEKNEALDSQKKFFKRRSAVAGTIIAGIFMLPVLICLIVNLAVGGAGWFFIVLAAMLVPVSLVAVPLLAPENKGLWTLSSFSISLILLFAVVCIITRGSWFFIASTASLFGIWLVFSPFAARSKPIASRIGSHKGLAVLGLDTVMFALMMISIGITNSLGIDYYSLAARISLPIIGLVWAIFLTVRYLKVNGFFKAAICLASSGMMMFIHELILNISANSTSFYIRTDSDRYVFGTNILFGVVLMLLALIFAGIGFIVNRNRRKTK